MGLDMYLEGKTFLFQNWRQPEKDLKIGGFRVKEVVLELGYWRKHPNLHGYIVQEFADGVDECQEIELSADNIRQIIQAIKDKALPNTEGFFFGQSDGSEDAESIEIFERALEWLEAEKKPPEPEKIEMGAGMSAVLIKSEDVADINEMRSVVYQASW